MDTPPRRLVTIKQAAAIASVSTRTINLWIQRGLLTTWRTVGGSQRIDPDSLFRPADQTASAKCTLPGAAA